MPLAGLVVVAVLALFWHQLLCARCGLGKSRVALVHAKRSVAPLSSEKHISKIVFFAAQIRACAAVFVDVAVVTLRPFKSFQLFSTVDFRNFFVSFSFLWHVGASCLRARCGLRRYRLRHSQAKYLLSQIPCDSYTVERLSLIHI